jgi:diguanylate cyclase (GGDEF)-like protein
VLLPGESNHGTSDWGEKLRAAVASLRLDCDEGEPLKVTASFGAAHCGEARTDDWRPIVERADQALYTAKRDGRNRVVTL